MPTLPRSKQELFWWRKRRVVGLRRQHKLRVGERLSSQMSKRRRFVIVALVLTFCLFVIQRLPVERRSIAIVILGILSWGLSSWSLLRDLVGVAWLTDLILPVLFPVAVAAFYFLLPQLAATRLVVLGLFAISMYALLLTANIFAVATNRTIQLLRAARTVGFLLSVVTVAFIYHVIFSFRLPFWTVVGLNTLVTFPIILQGLWSYTLERKMGKGELIYSLVGSVIVMELTLAVVFWAIEPLMASVVLSMLVYVLLGLFQHDLDRRLFSKTIQEYVGFAVIVFVIVVGTVLLRWMA